MLRNFKLSGPQAIVRICLGILLLANLVAAGFAFHLFDVSPEALQQQLAGAFSQQQSEQAHLVKSRALAANIDRGKSDGEKFLAGYMTPRRTTFSTIMSEITQATQAAGMDKLAGSNSLNPIPGSDDLDMMSITVSAEGKYAQLVKFINLLDRSPRFIIIESLTVTPRAKSDILTVNVKLDTFVKDDKDGIS